MDACSRGNLSGVRRACDRPAHGHIVNMTAQQQAGAVLACNASQRGSVQVWYGHVAW
jgi:hypothetical protein